MDDSLFLRLVAVFAPLSLLSFGGGQSVIGEMHTQSVEVFGWLTNQEFANFFALSRAAPGPSTLIATLIGWHILGIPGALVASVAMFAPSSLLVYGVGRLWQRNQGARWLTVLERSLTPLAIGLMFAGGFSVLEASSPTLLSLMVTAAAALVLYFTRIGPYSVIIAVVLLYLPLAFL